LDFHERLPADGGWVAQLGPSGSFTSALRWAGAAGGKHSLEFRRARYAICADIEPSTDRLRRTRTIFDGCPCRKSNPDILMVFMNEITAAYPATAIHVVLDNLNTHEPKEELQREISPCGGSNPPAPAIISY
jgi:hypothetical protein